MQNPIGYTSQSNSAWECTTQEQEHQEEGHEDRRVTLEADYHTLLFTFITFLVNFQDL